MNIPEEVSYDKDGHIERFGALRRLFPSLVIILVATLSFGIGRLSVVGHREPIKIEYDQNLAANTIESPQITTQTASVVKAVEKVGTSVVVSKNGTKYHYLYCPGAKQIKEENKITFATPQAAEAAGFTLAANCRAK